MRERLTRALAGLGFKVKPIDGTAAIGLTGQGATALVDSTADLARIERGNQGVVFQRGRQIASYTRLGNASVDVERLGRHETGMRTAWLPAWPVHRWRCRSPGPSPGKPLAGPGSLMKAVSSTPTQNGPRP